MRRYVGAFNRGDLHNLRWLLAEDVEFRDVSGKGLFEKIEPIRRRWGARDSTSQARQLGIRPGS